MACGVFLNYVKQAQFGPPPLYNFLSLCNPQSPKKMSANDQSNHTTLGLFTALEGCFKKWC